MSKVRAPRLDWFPNSGVKLAPVEAIAKPEMVEEAAFDVYANFPLGVIAFQQLASPREGT